jgi:hypothetical membrane protein
MWARRLAWGAIVAQVVFIASWLVGGAIEGHGYSVATDDISDLGALTAHHPTLVLVAFGISGALTIAFALGVIRPVLGVGGWLLALSLPALDNLSDAFFRLDCRAADAGCSASNAAASWHGKVHIAVFLVAAVATIATPFVLARSMRHVDGWRDLAPGARIFGVVIIVGAIANAVLTGTSVQGLAQRTLAVIVPLGIVALAVRVLQLNAVGLPGGKPMSNALRVYETSA